MKKLLTVSVVKSSKGLPRKVVKSQALETFKTSKTWP